VRALRERREMHTHSRLDAPQLRMASVATGLATLVLALAACGNDSVEPAAVEAATQTFTDTAERTVEVPVHPKRIVSLHEWTSAEALLSIDAPMVGLVTRDGDFAVELTADYDLSGVEPVGEEGDFDLEAVAGLEPDLILAQAHEGEPQLPEGMTVEQVEVVAPVVFLDNLQKVDDLMGDIGTLTGMEDVVEKQKASYEAARAEFMNKHAAGAGDLSFTLVGYDEENVYAIAPDHNSPIAQLAVDLGLKFPPVAREASFWASMSPERIRDVSADIVLWHKPSNGDPTAAPLWRTLPAVAAGKARELNYWPPTAVYTTYERTITEFSAILDEADPSVVDESGW
jgi:iron complex transport system substrate-binding protein